MNEKQVKADSELRKVVGSADATTVTPMPLSCNANVTPIELSSDNATTTHDELISEMVKRVVKQMRENNIPILDGSNNNSKANE